MHLMAKVITHQQQTYNCTRYSRLCEPHFLGHSVHRCCKLVMPSLADMVASHNQHGLYVYHSPCTPAIHHYQPIVKLWIIS